MSVCRFRTLGLIVGWAAVLLPIQAYALSLGGFQVESALDEPLKAEIQLQSVDPETLDSLEVTLGSAQDFRRADVPRSQFLRQLQFTVTETEDGGAVVKVTSQQPMKEPFLHFLISAQWSGGKLVREYTGLLDPPLYAEGAPVEVESPAVDAGQTAQSMDQSMDQSTEQEMIQAAKEMEPGEADTVSSITPPASGAAEYGPTQEGDTLWNIASRLDTGAVQANVFQIMLALQRQNPDAFIDNNMNRLKTGAVLRLDDVASVAEISAEQASAAYTAQLEEWRSTQPTQVASAETAEPEPAADEAADTAEDEAASSGDQAADQAAADTDAEAEESAAAEGQQEDVLRIVQATVDETQQSETASAGTDRSGEIAELQSQVATLQESLESRNLENEELRERVRLLESQLENAQRLIEIESQELAAAQQQAAQAQQEAAEAQAQAAQAQQQAEEQAAMAEAAGQPEPGAEADMAAAESDTEQVAAQSVQPVEEAGQEMGQETMESPAATDAGEETQGAAESGAGDTGQAGQASSAPQAESGQQASAAGATNGQSGEGAQKVRTVSGGTQASWWSRLPDMLFSSWMWMVGSGLGVVVLVLGLLMFLRRRQSIAEFEESILSGSALDSHSETSDSAATSASDTSFLSDFGTAGMGTMQADEVDPLAEAEVYLAYGRDEQAEDVLKEAARRDPSRSEVKLKLLEIYKQRNDVKSFETIAEELYPAGDSGDREVWNQVTAMGRELSPNNPLFQEAAPGEASGGEAPAPAPEMEPPAASDTAPRETPGAMNLDMDELGPAREQAPETEQAPAAAAAAPASSEAGAGEFSLDLDQGMEPQPEAPQAERVEPSSEDNALSFADDFLERPSGDVDPATQPFPAPDEQTDLDRELERLASEREAGATPAAADSGTGGNGPTPPPSQQANWEKADSDAGTLDFPASDTSDIDFDLNLDENSIQQLSGSDTSDDVGTPQTAAAEAGSSANDAGEGLMEFESEDLPPQETWAGPSSDAAQGGDQDSVSYSPTDDVRSAGAPQYNEAETKLDLARAYLDMGDKVGARSIIDEVMREGDPSQRDQAAELAAQL